jgi:hypothetical protein
VLTASVPCEACEGSVLDGDKHCTSCGILVSDGVRAALQRRRTEKEEHERARKDGQAAELARLGRLIRIGQGALLIAVLFMFGEGFSVFSDAVSSSRRLVAEAEALPEAYVWVSDLGDHLTRDELRVLYDREPGRVLVRYATTSALLAGLSWWALRAPAAALLASALSYWGMLLGAGPTSAGMVFKLAIVAILAGSARAAFAARRLTLRTQEPSS